MNSSTQTIKLTEYSHGQGCGCKISPKILDAILTSSFGEYTDANLLVGNHTNDDAAVYDLGNGEAIISTTDFFMPIVDDAFTFGRIAATNAISDVYAMGGTPIMAIGVGNGLSVLLPTWTMISVTSPSASLPFTSSTSISTWQSLLESGFSLE